MQGQVIVFENINNLLIELYLKLTFGKDIGDRDNHSIVIGYIDETGF